MSTLKQAKIENTKCPRIILHISSYDSTKNGHQCPQCQNYHKYINCYDLECTYYIDKEEYVPCKRCKTFGCPSHMNPHGFCNDCATDFEIECLQCGEKIPNICAIDAIHGCCDDKECRKDYIRDMLPNSFQCQCKEGEKVKCEEFSHVICLKCERYVRYDHLDDHTCKVLADNICYRIKPISISHQKDKKD